MEKEKNGIKKSEEDDSEKIRRLEAQVLQLKNIIIKLTHQQSKEEQGSDHGSFQKKGRPFDFNLYTKRHVALHVCYFGWDFHGFAVQEITGRTIESELFHALTLTKLVGIIFFFCQITRFIKYCVAFSFIFENSIGNII